MKGVRSVNTPRGGGGASAAPRRGGEGGGEHVPAHVRGRHFNNLTPPHPSSPPPTPPHPPSASSRMLPSPTQLIGAQTWKSVVFRAVRRQTGKQSKTRARERLRAQSCADPPVPSHLTLSAVWRRSADAASWTPLCPAGGGEDWSFLSLTMLPAATAVETHNFSLPLASACKAPAVATVVLIHSDTPRIGQLIYDTDISRYQPLPIFTISG